MRMICLYLSICFNTTFSDPSCCLRKIPSHFTHILITQSRYKPLGEREPRDSAAVGSQGARCSCNSYRRMLFELKNTFLSVQQATQNTCQSRKSFPTSCVVLCPRARTLTVTSQPSDDTALLERPLVSRAIGFRSLSESRIKVWGNTQGQESWDRLHMLNEVLTLLSKIT